MKVLITTDISLLLALLCCVLVPAAAGEVLSAAVHGTNSSSLGGKALVNWNAVHTPYYGRSDGGRLGQIDGGNSTIGVSRNQSEETAPSPTICGFGGGFYVAPICRDSDGDVELGLCGSQIPGDPFVHFLIETVAQLKEDRMVAYAKNEDLASDFEACQRDLKVWKDAHPLIFLLEKITHLEAEPKVASDASIAGTSSNEAGSKCQEELPKVQDTNAEYQEELSKVQAELSKVQEENSEIQELSKIQEACTKVQEENSELRSEMEHMSTHHTTEMDEQSKKCDIDKEELEEHSLETISEHHNAFRQELGALQDVVTESKNKDSKSVAYERDLETWKNAYPFIVSFINVANNNNLLRKETGMGPTSARVSDEASNFVACCRHVHYHQTPFAFRYVGQKLNPYFAIGGKAKYMCI